MTMNCYENIMSLWQITHINSQEETILKSDDLSVQLLDTRSRTILGNDEHLKNKF